MKNITNLLCLAFGFCLVLHNFASAQEKRILLTSPIESINYTLSSRILKIEVKLREASITESVSSTPHSRFELKSLIVTNDKNISGQNPKDDTFDAKTLTYTYRIEVLPIDGDDVFGGQIRLQPNWEKFTFTIPYSFSIENITGVREFKSPTYTIYRSLVPAREVNLDVRLPIWSLDRNGRTDYLAVPIQAENDIRVSVELRDTVTNLIVATGRELLKRSELQSIRLKLTDGSNIVPNRNYKVEISSQSQDIKIALASQKTDWTQARSTIIYKIEENEANTRELQKLKKVTSPERAFGISLSTTKPGSLRMVFDDPSISPIIGTSDTAHNFTMNFAGRGDGTYSFQLEGVGQDTDPIVSEKKYSVTIDSKTRIEDLVEFELDSQNVLKVRYTLSRNVTRTSLNFKDLGGFTVQATPVNNIANRYEVALSLEAASILITRLKADLQKTENSDKNQVPVKFFVTVENSDRPSEEIGSFSLLAVRINKSKLTEDLKTKLEPARAKEVALDVLGYKTQPAAGTNEESAVNYLIEILQKKTTDTSKQKFTSFLKFAGKVAAGYFGIPVPF